MYGVLHTVEGLYVSVVDTCEYSIARVRQREACLMMINIVMGQHLRRVEI